ncbi:MAG: hypothetical protein H0X30_33335 [Anaerolineae bacterium]|nr:hypothetical protein [Anaerolineae bacterium]
MANWKVTYIDEDAARELIAFFENEDVRDEIKRIIKILASQRDPRNPSKSAGLIVDAIQYDSPGWFRVKVPRYALRIIFRILVVRQQQVVEISPDELVDETEERYIDITRIGRHPDVYGKGLRERYRQLRNK